MKKSKIKYLALCSCFLFTITVAQAQFQVTEEGLTIIVTDGTEKGKDSNGGNADGIPTSYDNVDPKKGGKATKPANPLVLTDPIRELGMTDCIQAAAFLERPKYGKSGFMLIFSTNDSIGGKQATLVKNGKTYKGVYRLVKQKLSADEAIPEGMTTYKIEGTFLLLGVS